MPSRPFLPAVPWGRWPGIAGSEVEYAGNLTRPAGKRSLQTVIPGRLELRIDYRVYRLNASSDARPTDAHAHWGAAGIASRFEHLTQERYET